MPPIIDTGSITQSPSYASILSDKSPTKTISNSNPSFDFEIIQKTLTEINLKISTMNTKIDNLQKTNIDT